VKRKTEDDFKWIIQYFHGLPLSLLDFRIAVFSILSGALWLELNLRF
jgi:hypothetical protein